MALQWVEIGSIQGKSAYEVAVANGFVGDEAAWLASLKGADGADGAGGGGAAEVTVGTADPDADTPGVLYLQIPG